MENTIILATLESLSSSRFDGSKAVMVAVIASMFIMGAAIGMSFGVRF
jgi:hypothetical protein